MKVLVAYGSKHGGTAGIADTVAEQLREDGLDVDVSPAGKANKLDPYDAVVVGGALYRNRWHHDASMFVRRHKGELRQRPTYFFSSGPLGGAFSGHNAPPVPEVRLLANRVHAREHVTFNGSLPDHVNGFMDQKVAAVLAGDYRDRDEEKAWAHHVAEDVRTG
ncbi:MAG TPA: flavodoxin domain-containing protein [Acidimicrobiales bacterium]|nr:flavodoxin domain-containing protein [Acidimicrobiales bacterium]